MMRAGVGPVRLQDAIRRSLEWALSKLTLDLGQGRRRQFYLEVSKLEIVGAAGQTTPAYGVAWDHQLRPVWQYPSADRAGLEADDDEEERERGIPITGPRIAAVYWSPAIGARAA